jgi:FtsP/CotA-like multicopper oxidase with cupredoxin domain
MQDLPKLSRRGFLLGGGGAAVGAAWPGIGHAMQSHARKIAPNMASPNFNPDVEIELVCRPDSAPILQGAPTRVWRYVANLVKGPQKTLTALPNSYLGPILRFATGQKIRIRLRNELPEPTITHWHGLHVPMLMDGHPMYAIDPGESYVYEFEMRNRASMNIYHPHPHEATATQVYRGLAGAIIVNDEEERALGLPSGEYEIPIVIQDRTLNDDNQLVYGGGMHMDMIGFQGERILVNGRPDYRIDVASRAYRLRIMNGSNARIYKLAWDDGTPLTVIGVDGGLLERSEIKPYVMLAPGERLDLWADFSGRAVGSRLVMGNASFRGAMPPMAERMMGGMMGGGLRQSMAFPIFTVNVTGAESDSPKLPQMLSKIVRYEEKDFANLGNPIPIAISAGHMNMLLNGAPYGDDLQPREHIPVDTVQLIDIFHEAGGGHMGGMGHGMMGHGMMGHGMRRRGMGGMGMGGMGMMGMMSMAHPIHLHGEPFQIVGRVFNGDADGGYATMREGFVNSGWKDTVLVPPGERVRIAKPFHDFKGRFMYHCHNLEHEDMGMMREFSVE